MGSPNTNAQYVEGKTFVSKPPKNVGEISTDVENAIYHLEMNQMGISKEVAECPLCTAAAMETPEAVFAGGRAEDPTTFVILQTKNMKGHEWRYMILTTKHVANIPNIGQAEAYLYYYMRLRGVEAFEIMEPNHATVKDHWHRVASDMETGDDRELVGQTDRIQVIVKQDDRNRK